MREQPTKQVLRTLRDAGWTAGKTVGSHTKWHCPALRHAVSVPDGHRTISPGVLRKVLAALEGDNCKAEEAKK